MCECVKMLIFAHIRRGWAPLPKLSRSSVRRVAASLISLMAWVFNWTILYDNEKKIQIGFGQKGDF